MSMTSRVAILATALQLATGCSWAFMQKAPEPVAAPNYPVDCTASRAAPVLDTICAGYFVANGIYLASQKTCDQAAFGETCVDSGTKTGGILLSAGLATLCAVSAGSGYGNAKRCEGVKSENALCITGDEAACKRLNATWQPPLKLPPSAMVLPAAAPAPVGAEAIPPVGTPGCSKDADCKGDRICEKGTCVSPPPKAAP